MDLQTLLAFVGVATIAIVSPGPATLLAIRNGAAFGVRSVVWSALGNVCGLAFLSCASMLGLGVVLESSALAFGVVKLVGALYLFYIGIRQIFGKTSSFNALTNSDARVEPKPGDLYREALFTAATNPKPILFFAALFPQFIDNEIPLLPQFLVLTAIFVVLSFISLICYAVLASRARNLFLKPNFAKWLNGCFGALFIAFGIALLTLRRRASQL